MRLFFFFFFLTTRHHVWPHSAERDTLRAAHHPRTRVGVVCIPALPLLGDSFDLDKASEVTSTQGGLHTGLRVMLMRDA